MGPIGNSRSETFFVKIVIGVPITLSNLIFFENKCVMEIDVSSEPAEDETDGGVWIVTRSVSNRNYPG